jgi:D-alanyl-D-alanine carboxypeptidase/D-alanyl-D-alanine-endopeptidase (penicillin-binding protein 4)
MTKMSCLTQLCATNIRRSHWTLQAFLQPSRLPLCIVLACLQNLLACGTLSGGTNSGTSAPGTVPGVATGAIGAPAPAVPSLRPPALRTSPSYRARLQTGLDAVLAAIAPGTHLGVMVVNAADNGVLYERNARERFMPASTLKLFTAAAALYYLGPTHRFLTDVLLDEPEHGGRLVRNVYLRGSGDPSLLDADLAALASALRQQSIVGITGDIVVDDTAFDSVPWARGWMWDDLAEGFASPVSGINVMHNELVVNLHPGNRPEAPARLLFAPNSDFITLVNNVVTGAAGSAPKVALLGLTADSTGLVLGQTLTLQGSLPVDSGMWTRRFSVHDPALYAGMLLREHLHAGRVEVTGVVRRGTTPATAVLSARHASRELSASLIDFVKASNNHGMECLLKRLGANTALQPGTWKNGVAAVKTFLAQQVGLEPSLLTVADGSGDSRYSFVTPQQIAVLLGTMRRSFTTGPEFVAALPIGGMDGTLRNRMLPPELHGKVRAKTGTMTAVSNLAGYLVTDEQDILTFVIMSEGYTGGADAMRRLQDDLLLTLARTK